MATINLTFAASNLSKEVQISPIFALAEVALGDSTLVVNGSKLDNATLSVDDPAPPRNCPLFELILYSIAMGVLGVCGFVGNTASFMVLRRDHSAPVASFLLQALAVVDNMFLLLWMLHYSVRYLLLYVGIDLTKSGIWLYLRVCTFPLLYMAQMETIWLTVVIAMNRYMAICRPYKAPHLCTIGNVYKEVIIVTAFSILYNVPRFFELAIVQTENGTTWKRTEFGYNSVYATIYVDVLYYLFTFVFPLLVLAFVNTRVTIAYQATRKRKRRMTSRRAENESNITLVMIIVVLIFMVCQAPARIVQLITNYEFPQCRHYSYYFIHISNTLEVLNSSINFLVYFLFRKRFRDILWDHLCLLANTSSVARRDSGRMTTTEGLSLAHFEHTSQNVPDVVGNGLNLRQDTIIEEEEGDVSGVGGPCGKVVCVDKSTSIGPEDLVGVAEGETRDSREEYLQQGEEEPGDQQEQSDDSQLFSQSVSI